MQPSILRGRFQAPKIKICPEGRLEEPRFLRRRSPIENLNISGRGPSAIEALPWSIAHFLVILRLRNWYGNASLLVVDCWPLLAARSKPSGHLPFKLGHSARLAAYSHRHFTAALSDCPLLVLMISVCSKMLRSVLTAIPRNAKLSRPIPGRMWYRKWSARLSVSSPPSSLSLRLALPNPRIVDCQRVLFHLPVSTSSYIPPRLSASTRPPS